MLIRSAANDQDIYRAAEVWWANQPPEDEEDRASSLKHWLYLFRADSHGFWLAEDEQTGQIVGIASAKRCPPQWILTNFFVHPGYHGQGIGRTLLTHAYAYQADCDRFLVHASTHPSAQSLYLSFGMWPQPTSIYMTGKPKMPIMPPVDVSAAPCNLEIDLPTLNALDQRALGFTRAHDHRWLATHGAYSLLRATDQTVGYFCVSPRGEIGPLVVSEPRWMAAALDLAIRAAIDTGAPSHSMLVPGANVTALSRLFAYGYRYTDIELLLSSQPLPNLDCAIFHDTDLL